MSFENIPAKLRQLDQWVVWGVPGKKTKLPFNPITMNTASAGQPQTWGSYDDAVKRVQSGMAKGIGFEFHNNGIVGVDLDTIRDPQTGKVAAYALEIIHKLNSFTEVSQSGYGIHVFCFGNLSLEFNKAKLPPNSILRPDIDEETGQQKIDKTGALMFKKPEIEIYNQGRYFAMTGILFEEVGCL